MTDRAANASGLPSTAHRPARCTFLKRLAGGIVTATVILLLIEGALRLVWRFAGSEASRNVRDPLARALCDFDQTLGAQVERRLIEGRGAGVLTATAIYRTLEWTVATRSPHIDDTRSGEQTIPHYRVALEQSLANFRAMIDESRRGGATVLIVNLPRASGFPRTKGIEEFTDAVEGAFRQDAEFVALPEMSAQRPETKRYFQSDGFHPNAAGTAYIAQGVADAILRARTEQGDSR